ncbi:MAG TPA: hypothetical protein VF049_22155 [Nocardioidaceae bacterium]
MDDTTTIDNTSYTVAIGGVDYTFTRGSASTLERMIAVKQLGAGEQVLLRATVVWLASAAGEDVWQAILLRFVNDEITVQDLLNAMHSLTGQMAKTTTDESTPATDAA